MILSDEIIRKSHFFFVLLLAVVLFKLLALEREVVRLHVEHEALGKRFELNDVSLKEGNSPEETKSSKPIAWIRGRNKDYGYLSHVRNVLEHSGYEVHTGTKLPDGIHWNLLWNHEFPFRDAALVPQLRGLRDDQLVNHVPGSGFITSKVALASTRLSAGIPLAFALPQQAAAFREFAARNPAVRWVQKSNEHRGIAVVQPDAVDVNRTGTFVQQFVDGVFTIDGRKFDIGVYVVVTSLSPLRVYAYEGDLLLRFCSKDYRPFNASDVDAYVIGDDYTPVWEMPSLDRFFNKQRLNSRESLRAFCSLPASGCDFERISSQIRATIGEVFERNNEKMRAAMRAFPTSRRFFELIRFDFLVDERMAVWLLEANMSPNLSSGHFRQNAALYEEVLRSVFSLVGVEAGLEGKKTRLNVSDRELFVDLEECRNGSCTGCPPNKQEDCGLCAECIDADLLADLRRAHREHVERRAMRRVFPTERPFASPMPQSDRLQRRWFAAMCRKDAAFCSQSDRDSAFNPTE
ncbi:hypothetical protein M3Y99_01597100 [Aphelenchoides fujianensis]|nr:hypothetical protein M3Y99_01597100 [Aphelenchoides fujianensis]